MAKHARNYKRVFDMYNLDLDPPKDSDMGKALAAHRSRMKRAQALVDRGRQEEGRRVDRLGRAAGEPPEVQALGPVLSRWAWLLCSHLVA